MTTTAEEPMAKKKAVELVRFGAYLRADQVEALQRIQERDGVAVAYMIRSGVDRELEARGERKGARHGR
jgi:hypothetical protein